MAVHPYLDTQGPIAFAHRGAAESTAENSFQAVERAHSLGYTHVETDVQATRDGVAVLFHDDTTDRLLGRKGKIRDFDWADLEGMELHGGGEIARLDQVLRAFPRLRLNLDAKTDDAVKPMGDVIAAAGALDRVCAASFRSARTQALRMRFGDRLCWSPAMGGVAKAFFAARMHMPFGYPPCLQVPTSWNGITIVTDRFVAAAHRRGAQVHVWTVDEPDEMERLLDLGVDGLMTDRPRVLRDVMRRRGFWDQA
ncbi:glycerophosphodiester phosphodiesterase family protein [Palleronia sp. LCG004]|uniref:glycerophosphodiester phosphodiesterase family protein n=1 Tax=Palleronia sp. LCG004 TaxID=3079304 RepID=UPI0029420D8F|nr:glycerophosphodiester phosphodiesterase family protein [Palleronia sp. LCG004]WOI56999.1 glycerophosphodiester phosphodiesterase family protein [Palleronia sp. LCG004]